MASKVAQARRKGPESARHSKQIYNEDWKRLEQARVKLGLREFRDVVHLAVGWLQEHEHDLLDHVELQPAPADAPRHTRSRTWYKDDVDWVDQWAIRHGRLRDRELMRVLRFIVDQVVIPAAEETPAG